MDTTKKIKCTCANKAQDDLNGRGVRLHNYAEKGMAGQPGWRCVVCTNVKSAS